MIPPEEDDKKGKKPPVKPHLYYEIKDGQIDRLKQSCPRCGDGVFLADHEDRRSCGKCGYTEFKRKKKEE